MKHALKVVFDDARERIRHGFTCEEHNIHRVCEDPNNARALRAVEFQDEGAEHCFRYFMPSTINIQQDFSDFLTRDVVLHISKIFHCDRDKPDHYLQILFQYFVHDGKNLPHSINDIVINDDESSEVKSETVLLTYKNESNVYSQPTMLFRKYYKNWDIHGPIPIDGSIYPEARRNDILLGDILQQQHLTPLSRHLIKLWIIHLCVSHIDQKILEKNAFFNNPGLENILETLQKNINSRISNILEKSIEERKILAARKVKENPYALPPRIHTLVQRIPLFKFIAGGANYDIHNLAEGMGAYIKSHSNIPLSKYLLNKIRKNFAQSMIMLRRFMRGQENITFLLRAASQFVKSLYLGMWFPF